MKIYPYDIYNPKQSNNWKVKKHTAYLDIACINEKSEKKILRVTGTPFTIELVVFEKYNTRVSELKKKTREGVLQTIERDICNSTGADPEDISRDTRYSNFTYIKNKVDVLIVRYRTWDTFSKARYIIKSNLTTRPFGKKLHVHVVTNSPKNQPQYIMFKELGLNFSTWFEINHEFSAPGPHANKDVLYIDYNTLKSKLVKLDDISLPNGVICSYDIETLAMKSTMPSSSIQEDVIVMLSAVFIKLNGDGYDKYVYYLGSKKITDDKFIEDFKKSDDTTIVCCKDEEEIIRKWYNKLISENVFILMGQNIFGYDCNYIKKRIMLNNLMMPKLGIVDDIDDTFGSVKWESAAFGVNIIDYFNCTGIVNFDTLFHARQTRTLNSYSLNAIAKDYGLASKEDIGYQEMFTLYRKVVKLMKVEPFEENLNTQLQNDVINLRKSILPKLHLMLKYSIRDSVIVADIFKLHIATDVFVSSKISDVSIFDLYARGQQRKLNNLIYKKSIEYGYTNIVPLNYDNPKTGGCVFVPTQGVHHNVVTLDFEGLYPSIMIGENIVPSMLYLPSINDHDEATLVKRFRKDYPNAKYRIINIQTNKEDDEDIDLGEMLDDPINIVDADDESFEDTFSDIVKTTYVEPIITEMPLIFSQDRKGLLVYIEIELKAQRSKYKSLMKAARREGNVLLGRYYDACQKAIKVLMNSIYGSLGAPSSSIYCLPVASAVPTVGRKLVVASAMIAMALGCNMKYGDTDSIMLEMVDKSYTSIAKYVKTVYTEEELAAVELKSDNIEVEWLSKLISDCFGEGIRLRWEKTATCMIMYKKKRYVMYQTDGKVLIKGLPIVRRDKCKYIKEILIKLNDLIRDDKFYEAVGYVISKSINLINGNVVDTDLVTTRRMGDNYTNQNSLMVLFRQNCRKYGIEVLAGDRKTLIVTVGDKGSKLGSRCITLEGLRDNGMIIDYLYYVWNDLRLNLQSALLIGFKYRMEFIERYRLINFFLRFIKQYVDEVDIVVSLNNLMVNKLNDCSLSVNDILNKSSKVDNTCYLSGYTEIQGKTINNLVCILNLVTIERLVVHLLTIYPEQKKKKILEMRKQLISRTPVAELQANVVEAIAKYKIMSKEEPEKYNWELFEKKFINLDKDTSWEYYFKKFKGDKTLSKQDNKQIPNLLNNLQIPEELYIKLLKDIKNPFDFTECIVPKIQGIKQVLTENGLKIWNELNLDKLHNSLSVIEH